jgi:invasion protein IalB
MFATRRLTLAALAACSLALPLSAQELPLGPRSDFGKVVLTNKQVSGGSVTLEQVFGGGFDSEPAYQYPEISGYRKMGRAVGRLDIATDKGTAHCTSFLISDQYLLTNAHCLQIDGARVQAVNFVAGYVENGVTENTRIYSVNPDPVEISPAADLDYAILEVFGAPAQDWGTLPLQAFDFDPDRHAGLPLIVIGHPIDMAQHISRKECRAAARNLLSNNRLRHTCDTLRGNSGSPVIGEDGRKVVALHHAGDSINGVNFAVPIASIAERSPIVAALTAPEKPVAVTPPRETSEKPENQYYVEGRYDDWDLQCTTVSQLCQGYQLLKDGQDNSVAEIAVFKLANGGRAVAAGIVVTPKETLLSKGLTLEIDGDQALKYDFAFCNDQGCTARIGIDAETFSRLERGREAKLTIYPAAAPDTPVTLRISLRGFTRAMTRASTLN